MRIFITVGTGFMGSALTDELICRGQPVTVPDGMIRSRPGLPGCRCCGAVG